MQRRALGFFFIAVAFALFGESAWIPAKAQLAQLLLARAWERRVSGVAEPKPWPWADTWPVALLRAPRLGEERIVLAGASGRNMAFGPTHVQSSANLGEDSNAVISGHRDTHFAFLESLRVGDELLVDTPDGKRHRYRVEATDVVDESDLWVLDETDEKVLTLVTCFPFDAIVPRGPGRFVVRAVASDLDETTGAKRSSSFLSGIQPRGLGKEPRESCRSPPQGEVSRKMFRFSTPVRVCPREAWRR